MTAVMRHRRRYEPDELALSIVCVERVPMSLTGPDRREAVRRLTAKGLSANDIAPLVRSSPDDVGHIQRRLGIQPAAPGQFYLGFGIPPRRNRAR